MIDLNTVSRVHFIGIGGVGMRAIADIFIDKGYIVSGSDAKSSPATARLGQRGARICILGYPPGCVAGAAGSL